MAFSTHGYAHQIRRLIGLHFHLLKMLLILLTISFFRTTLKSLKYSEVFQITFYAIVSFDYI